MIRSESPTHAGKRDGLGTRSYQQLAFGRPLSYAAVAGVFQGKVEI